LLEGRQQFVGRVIVELSIGFCVQRQANGRTLHPVLEISVADHLRVIGMLLRQLLLNLHPFELLACLTRRKNIRVLIYGCLNSLLWVFKEVYFRFFLFYLLLLRPEVLLDKLIGQLSDFAHFLGLLTNELFSLLVHPNDVVQTLVPILFGERGLRLYCLNFTLRLGFLVNQHRCFLPKWL